MQDLIEPHYEEMVKVLGNVLAENPPLAMVGGHDHSLQILDGGSEARLVVVSGAASKVTGVTSMEGTLFAHGHRGFVVFDFHRAKENIDGVLLVNVVETGRGERPVFSLALDLEREQAPPQKVPPRRKVPPRPRLRAGSSRSARGDMTICQSGICARGAERAAAASAADAELTPPFQARRCELRRRQLPALGLEHLLHAAEHAARGRQRPVIEPRHDEVAIAGAFEV